MTHEPDHTHDDDLRSLLTDAVSDVEPAERLAQIRERTASQSTPFRTRRGWLAVGAAGLAAAAAVTAVAVVADSGGDGGSPGPADRTEQVALDPRPVTVYYVGPAASGPSETARLYPYVEQATSIAAALMQTPSDPDYRTLWPEGSILDIGEPVDGVVTVEVDRELAGEFVGSLFEPLGAEVYDSSSDLALGRDQLVQTVRAAFGDERLSIAFAADGETSRPFTGNAAFDVVTHLTISDPLEGQVVSGTFTATGESNGYEASVACWLYVGDDGGAWGPYVTTAEGWQDQRLFPWRLEIDLEKERVLPGSYEFSCTTDDPTGGAEGIGAFEDTRTVVVE